MANYDKPAFVWSGALPIDFDIQDFPIPSPLPSQLPNLVNSFGDSGSGVTPDEWGMPIVG